MLKIFKSRIKSKKELTERDIIGRNHVGYPTMQLIKIIDSVVLKYHSRLKIIVQFYEQTYFLKWMPSIMNRDLTDEQLKNLSGRHVQIAYLLLFRDTLRKLAPFMTKHDLTENWPDLLVDEVFQTCQIHSDLTKEERQFVDSLFISHLNYEIEAENLEEASLPMWGKELSQLIVIPAKSIYDTHRAMNLIIAKKFQKPRILKSLFKK